MSFDPQKTSCTRCHAYLFEEDDIVYCPICGAPHHRDCYAALGHCALEELHGTDRQYDKVKKQEEARHAASPESEHTGENAEGLISCPMCHEKYEFSRNTCPKCGAPNVARAGGSFASFDFLGGVPADYDIGDGVTADEAKRFVAANTQRYIPKFAALNKKNRASWNWLAFLFPCGWMLSRKMYKIGLIFGLFSVIASLFYLPFSKAAYQLGMYDAANYREMMQIFTQNFSQISGLVIAFSAIGLFVNLTLRVLSALFGDYFYKDYTLSSIKTIRAESEDMDYDYRKKGGVNIFFFLLGAMAVQYLPTMIATLIL